MSIVSAAVVSATSGTGSPTPVTTGANGLQNRFGMLVRNTPGTGNTASTPNTVTVLVLFHAADTVGFPLQPGEALALSPAACQNTNNLWLQSGDGATAQTLTVEVDGAG